MENKIPSIDDDKIIKAVECCADDSANSCDNCPFEMECYADGLNLNKLSLELINRKNAKIEELEQKLRDEGEALLAINHQLLTIRADAIKEFADKTAQLLERYSVVHKHADEARNDTDEYPDGTTSEMTSVWEVQSLTKHGMADYETMSELQKNIEYIAQERLLSELEKDFRLLIREMVGGV